MDAYNRGFNYLIRKYGYINQGPTPGILKELVGIKSKKTINKILEENFPSRFILAVNPAAIKEGIDNDLLLLIKQYPLSIKITSDIKGILQLLDVPHEFPKLEYPKNYFY